MPGHIIQRTITAATAPLVRKSAPWIGTMARAAVQFLLLGVLAGLLLIGVAVVPIPDYILKPLAVLVVLVACVFSLIVVAEQVRITYAKPKEAIYPTVEVFPDREPT